MFLILNRALSWAITSFGNKFCLRKRSRLIKALDNRFYVKFMQLEKGLLVGWFIILNEKYSIFHVTWTTFKFNRNQLGTVSAYVM